MISPQAGAGSYEIIRLDSSSKNRTLEGKTSLSDNINYMLCISVLGSCRRDSRILYGHASSGAVNPVVHRLLRTDQYQSLAAPVAHRHCLPVDIPLSHRFLENLLFEADPHGWIAH